MRTFLISLIRQVRASYWFLPSVMVLLAFVLASGTRRLDLVIDAEALRGFGPLSVASPGGARAILSAIAGSIISVAGVTFSITIATVSFASGNYGPRLIGNFMRDRANQATLGIFIATFVYAILILGSVRQSGEAGEIEAFIPYASLLVTLVLALISIGMLIYFFHHVPESIDIQHLTTEIGGQLRDKMTDLFPNDYDGSDEVEALGEDFDKAAEGRERISIAAGKDGYVETIDTASIERLAEEEDLLIDLQYAPGDFLTREDVLMDVMPPAGVSEGVADKLRSMFSVGKQKTPDQNVLFLVDTLVEIAGRALSPGINDPQTAAACFNWLHVGANAYGSRDEEAGHGPHRVKISTMTFDQFVSRSFSAVRPYAATDRNAALHLVTVLTEVAVRLPAGRRLARIEEELRSLVDEVEALNGNATWTSEVNERFKLAQRALRSQDARLALRNEAAWFEGRA
ncbi:DUF2254 domain-containing protein [Parvularcula maris]|uniref:DUF2254 domain-containing protein n=1 Tax=Parvularcula maris TaxID=2965077 RepID=A0A9X2L6T6_9PROT|nr:DUF2254 domain-containing protein [Parvularcula maris]MCQ8184120.1 DUF2254 domain-containing protein [Parvularcula maris]